MKKIGIMNADVSNVISKMGHTDMITIADSGLPIPSDTKRIDLSIKQGLPSFIDVLDMVLTELEVEEIVLAKEIKEKNEDVLKNILDRFENKKITWISHEEFKILTKESKAVIRTGECSPYANVILKSGVIF